MQSGDGSKRGVFTPYIADNSFFRMPSNQIQNGSRIIGSALPTDKSSSGINKQQYQQPPINRG
jgi:hypothetical protein